jgi:cellulose synthase/poly-beta-1,6-N-acetylglucosamine synthase-like glycosyltransferase
VLECERLPNCRVIQQQPLGKPAALNAGLAAASGSVVVLLDADSTVTRDWLRELVAPLDAVTRASTGNYLPSRLTPVSRVEQMERIVAYEIRRAPILQGSGSIAIARDLIDELGGFAVDAYADDWHLDARLAMRGVERRFCPGAMLRTERPATFREYWRNELRWRRAHLISLFQLHAYFFGDVWLAFGSLYPYLAAWGMVLVPQLAVFAGALGYPQVAMTALLLWGIGIVWVLLQRLTLVIEVVAFTRDARWLRDAWVPPVLFAMTLMASWVASLTTGRATMRFKGPRRTLKDETRS